MSEDTSRFQALGIDNPALLAAIAAVGYEEPSPIQEQSIPVILAGQDMIGQAQTGTGKTAAFALPILSRLDCQLREPQALILAPTRELALQVATAFETYAQKMTGVRVTAIYGGASMGLQVKAIRQGTQIIVATPGRLCDHLRRDASFLSSVRFLVLDEADEMLKLGFMEDIEAIFSALPEQRQGVLFSATLPVSIKAIAEQQLRDPKHVKIAARTQTVERIEQYHLLVHADQKEEAVRRLLEVEDFDALIAFVRTKQATLDLASLLEANGYKAAALNGDIAQNQRERIIESLKDGRLDIVVATDVAARGLDVPRITHVLNVDMPYDQESYVHRIGRTGRAGREGRALLLVTPRERRLLQSLERMTGQKIGKMDLPTADAIVDARIRRLTSSLQDIAGEAQKGYNRLLQQLMAQLDLTPEAMASALLHLLARGQGLTKEEAAREFPPLAPVVAKTRSGMETGRREYAGKGSERNTRNIAPTQGKVRCRTALGLRDGIAARNLLGAILNEAGLQREDIGCIQVKETFSLIELPEKGLERILGRLKDTRVAGKGLKMRRYRED